MGLNGQKESGMKTISSISDVIFMFWVAWTVFDIRDSVEEMKTKLGSIESAQIECNTQKGE